MTGNVNDMLIFGLDEFLDLDDIRLYYSPEDLPNHEEIIKMKIAYKLRRGLQLSGEDKAFLYKLITGQEMRINNVGHPHTDLEDMSIAHQFLLSIKDFKCSTTEIIKILYPKYARTRSISLLGFKKAIKRGINSLITKYEAELPTMSDDINCFGYSEKEKASELLRFAKEYVSKRKKHTPKLTRSVRNSKIK